MNYYWNFTHLENILNCKHHHIRNHYLNCYSKNYMAQDVYKLIYVFDLQCQYYSWVHVPDYDIMKTNPFQIRITRYSEDLIQSNQNIWENKFISLLDAMCRTLIYCIHKFYSLCYYKLVSFILVFCVFLHAKNVYLYANINGRNSKLKQILLCVNFALVINYILLCDSFVNWFPDTIQLSNDVAL